MTIFISTRVLMLLIYLSKNGAAVRLCSMRKHKSHYLGDCLEGDELTVYIWEDVQENYHLRCHIDKDKECIFQTIFSFFS